MKSVDIVSYLVEYGLRFTGIWPGVTYQSFIRLAWIFMMATAQVFQYWYILDHFNKNDLHLLVDCFSSTLPFSSLCIKLIIFWSNQRLFSHILAEMYEDWTNLSDDSISLNLMVKNAAISNRSSKLILAIYITAVVSYSIATINFISFTSGHHFNMESRELVVKMALPFSLEDQFRYECVILVQFFNLLFVGSAIGIIDSLMVALMLHIGAQIEIVEAILESLSLSDGKYTLPKAFLKDLVRKHYRIIKLSANVNQLFTYIALTQFLSNTLIICCIGFVVMSSLGSGGGLMILIRSTFFYLAITMEAFIFCFSGEYLRNESKKIGNAAYRSRWYTLTPSDRIVLLLVMLRSQKSLTITAGSFMELSLETFISMLKASASYISVLSAMA